MEERREKINNFLSELMKEKLGNEDLIFAKDIAEIEAEWEKKEKEKSEKTKADLKAIAEHRAIMVNNEMMINLRLYHCGFYPLCLFDPKCNKMCKTKNELSSYNPEI